MSVNDPETTESPAATTPLGTMATPVAPLLPGWTETPVLANEVSRVPAVLASTALDAAVLPCWDSMTDGTTAATAMHVNPANNVRRGRRVTLARPTILAPF